MADQVDFKVTIPEGLTKRERLAIADGIIEFIVNRTQNGRDKRNMKFRGSYSDSYKKSLDYANAGKTGEINLTLSGDMLAAIELIADQGNSLTIGITDPDVVGRAEGNILGTYGQPRQVAPKRDFLGIVPGDLKKIIREVAGNKAASE